MTKYHKCKEWKTHQQIQYALDTDIVDNTFIVYDTFTPVTEHPFKKEHPDSYHIPVSFCPFCGKSLV